MERRKYNIGSIIEVELGNEKKIAGLILGEPLILIFKKIYLKSQKVNLDDILGNDIWFYCAVSLDDKTLESISTIGQIEIPDTFINGLPPLFYQHDIDKDVCKLIYINGMEKKVLPKDCIGLESADVWPGKLWLNRIKDQLNNVNNLFLERSKVKL